LPSVDSTASSSLFAIPATLWLSETKIQLTVMFLKALDDMAVRDLQDCKDRRATTRVVPHGTSESTSLQAIPCKEGNMCQVSNSVSRISKGGSFHRMNFAGNPTAGIVVRLVIM
jgi:hypothetical protein